MSNLTALVERGPAERHDGHHVGRADARMNPAVRTQIDLLGRDADRGQKPVDHPGPGACQRNHDPVVVGVWIRVQHVGHARGRRDRIDHVAAPAFGKVGHRLEQACCHSKR